VVKANTSNGVQTILCLADVSTVPRILPFDRRLSLSLSLSLSLTLCVRSEKVTLAPSCMHGINQ
jgi:hypothetical protein